MKTEEEFLLEEYKESISTGQWLEEMIERKFKNLSTVFIWQMALLGLLLTDDLAIKNIIQTLNFDYSQLIIFITSLFVLSMSWITIDNMIKTRIGDVLRTSRTNFLRNYFLKEMPEDFKKIYFQNNRLKHVNKIEIYSRPAWSSDSDIAFYITLSAFIGAVSFVILLAFVIKLPFYLYPLIAIISLIIVRLYAKRKLNRFIPSKGLSEG